MAVKLTDEQFKKEYAAFQKRMKNLGTDIQFANYLNTKNYYIRYPSKAGKLDDNTIFNRRKILNIKAPVQSGTDPLKRKRFEDVTKFTTKEVAKANAGEKYTQIEDIKKKVLKKFKLTSFPNFKSDGYPVLKELDSYPEKVDKVLKNMLMENKPVPKNWASVVMDRAGIRDTGTFSRVLGSGLVPTYEVIKDQGADYIRVNYGRQFPKAFYSLPFSEQLTYAMEMQEGRPVFTNLPNKYGSRPDHKIMAFAKRSWNTTKGEGPVKFFNKKTGELIPWNFGTKLPFDKVAFSYEGKLHSYDDIKDIGYMKKYFPETYDTVINLKKLKNKSVDNPFGGGKIKVQDLAKKIQVEGYNWSPKMVGVIDILHGPEGVSAKPFTDLSYNTRDINQLMAGIEQRTRAGMFTQKQGASFLSQLTKALPSTEEDILKRQFTLAEKLKKGTMFNYKDMAGSVRGLFESVDKPTILQIRRAVGCDNADGGRIELQAGGDLLACPAKKFQNDPVGFTNKVNQIQQPTSGIAKFTNAAKGFLASGGFKTFGIGAAVGAGIGLVKAFRNDDPTTYLSNEDQQKNMLVDMATQPISTDIDRPAILDYQLPALGVAAAGSTALAAPSTIRASQTTKQFASRSRAPGVERKPVGKFKTGLRVLGRGLGVAASPALLAPLAVGDLASQIAAGDTPEDIATNPLNYLYPAFADQTPKLTRGLNPTVRKIARLGLPRIALKGLSRAGIGGFAASAMIQGLGLLDE